MDKKQAREILSYRNYLNEDGDPGFSGGVWEAFYEGDRLLSSMGVLRGYDPENPVFERMRLTHITQPPRLKGITYPQHFVVERNLDTQALASLSNEFQEAKETGRISEAAWKLWSPLVEAPSQTGESKLARLVAREAGVLEEDDRLQGISVHPSTAIEKGVIPKAFVPEADWFQENIRHLDIGDIVTFLPPTELELFTLWLGRLVVGFSGTIWAESETPFEHCARLAVILYGGAGIGKSTFLNLLIETLSRLGYQSATFGSIKGQFGMGRMVNAHLGYKDDLVDSTFLDILQSEFAKSVVTGGRVKVEEKYTIARETRSKCAFMACANNFEPHWASRIDVGSLSRYQILRTFDSDDLTKHGKDLRPAAHLPALANDLQVETETLVAWLLRLSADRFIETVEAGDLERKTKSLVASLDTRFPYGLIECAIPLMIWLHQCDGHDLKNLKALLASDPLKAVFTIKPGIRVNDIQRQVLREDYIKHPIENHPYRATQIDPDAWDRATSNALQTISRKDNELDGVAALLKQIYTVDGYHFIGSPRAVISTVNKVLADWGNTVKRYKHLMVKVKQLELQMAENQDDDDA